MAVEKILTKKKAKSMTIKSLKELGVYRREYEPIIDIYAGLLSQYEVLNRRFEEANYECEAKTAAENDKKSPLVAALENLRKDILQYSDRLKLNPKAYEKKENKKGETGQSLAAVLRVIGE